MFTKIDNEDQRSIREVVLDELRNAIFEDRLKEGDRLVENIIASSMGVSRTPVREALRQLEIYEYTKKRNYCNWDIYRGCSRDL